MEEVLNNLVIGETLYTTCYGTNYNYMGRSQVNGVKYSINLNQKTLPLNTIMQAFADHTIGIAINAQWYKRYDAYEYKTSPCNLSVLLALLARADA
jgi:hypothetical protein